MTAFASPAVERVLFTHLRGVSGLFAETEGVPVEYAFELSRGILTPEYVAKFLFAPFLSELVDGAFKLFAVDPAMSMVRTTHTSNLKGRGFGAPANALDVWLDFVRNVNGRTQFALKVTDVGRGGAKALADVQKHMRSLFDDCFEKLKPFWDYHKTLFPSDYYFTDYYIKMVDTIKFVYMMLSVGAFIPADADPSRYPYRDLVWQFKEMLTTVCDGIKSFEEMKSGTNLNERLV